MPRRTRPTVRDIQNATRLAWEAAELRHDPIAQGRTLVDGMAALVGGDYGFWCTMDRFVEGELPRFVSAVTGRHVPAELIRYFQGSGREFEPTQDPVVDFCRGVKQTSAVRISDLLPHCTPERHGIGIDIMERIGVKDGAVGLFRRADGVRVTGLSIHRTAIRRPYDARERAIVKTVIGELEHLYRSGRLEPPVGPLLDQLPRRLRQVAQLMLTDRPVKQIARELNLTVESARSYVKELYRRCGVASRQELMLKLMDRGG